MAQGDTFNCFLWVVGRLIKLCIGVTVFCTTLTTIACFVHVFAVLFVYDLEWTTKTLVVAVALYKGLLLFFVTIGATTLFSTVHSSLDLSFIWNFKGFRGLLDFKSYQPMGFILRPFGLLVVGGMLFVTQNVLQEGIMRGDALPQDHQCYFEHQVMFEHAVISGDMKGPYNSSLTLQDKVAAYQKCGFFDVECHADFLNIPVYSQSQSLWQWCSFILNYVMQHHPPSHCFATDQLVTVPFLIIPKTDFSPASRSSTEKHIEDAPAFFGTAFLPWQRDIYFAKNLRTPCHYVCTKAAKKTPVDFVMNLGIILGGGLSIVLGANEFGKYAGTPFVTPDTSPGKLTSRVLGDIRILLPILWTDHVGLCRKPYFFEAFRHLFLLFGKFWLCVWGAVLYRPYLDKYAQTYGDRVVMHCVFWLGLWVVVLRACFVFTEKVWQDGEDPNIMVITEQGMALTTVDLYSWLRLSRKELVERLIFYIRGVGQEELHSNKPIRVAAIAEVKGYHRETGARNEVIPAGSKGTIEKQTDGGASFEGRHVVVTWDRPLDSCAVDLVMLMQIEEEWDALDEIRQLAQIGTTPHEFLTYTVLPSE